MCVSLQVHFDTRKVGRMHYPSGPGYSYIAEAQLGAHDTLAHISMMVLPLRISKEAPSLHQRTQRNEPYKSNNSPVSMYERTYIRVVLKLGSSKTRFTSCSIDSRLKNEEVFYFLAINFELFIPLTSGCSYIHK